MCKLNSCTCSKGNKCPVAYPTYPGSLSGTNGWSPDWAVVPDGSTREVLKLLGWFGGTGPTPTDFVGQYVSSTGFTTVLADGENIKGSSGSSSGAWAHVVAPSIDFVNGSAPINGDTEYLFVVPSGGTFAVTAVSQGSLNYQKTGTTLLFNYNIVGTATIANAVESLGLTIYVRVPGGYTIANSGNFYPGNMCVTAGNLRYVGAGSAVVPGDTLLYGLTPNTYLISGFIYLNNLGGSVTTSFKITGSVMLETT